MYESRGAGGILVLDGVFVVVIVVCLFVVVWFSHKNVSFRRYFPSQLALQTCFIQLLVSPITHFPIQP